MSFKIALSAPAARACAAQVLRASRIPGLTLSDKLGSAAHMARVCAESERLAGHFASRNLYREAACAIESNIH